MADTKISALSDGSPAVATDVFPIARSGSNYKLPISTVKVIGGPELIYRYTVAGSDKASIDTGVDTPDAGSNDWTGGDLLEFFIVARTDESATRSVIDITLNNSGSAIYLSRYLDNLNTTVSGSGGTAATKWQVICPGATATAGLAACISGHFPNFTGTTFFKPGRIEQDDPHDVAAQSELLVMGVSFASTSAITRFAVAADTAGKKLKVGSQLLIYKRRSS